MQDAGGAGRWIAAVFAGLLPRALWPRLEGAFIPIHLASIPSAVMQLLAGFALGLPSFLLYAWRAANENTDLMLSPASRRQAGGADVTSAMSVGGSMLSPFAFVFFTPAGLVSTYLAGAGLVRLVAAIVEEPFGDPILTGLHRLGAHARARRAASVSAARRTALEGEELPDRVVSGAAAGIPAAEFVVIAARRKPGWEEGVLVVTGLGWFRIGRLFDEYHDGGLRTLYPLVRSPQSEIMRRAVSYRLPGQEDETGEAPGGEAGVPREVTEIPLSPDPLEQERDPRSRR
jgi:hypothetical protein